MPRIVQEKWQIVSERNDAEDSTAGAWVNSDSARVKKGAPGRNGVGTSKSANAYFFNSLPPGMDITDQEISDIREEKISRGNRGNGDQFTTDVDEQSLRQGFSRKSQPSTDGVETSPFFTEVEVDGVEGYLERGNVTDRS
jgi:hypothetical protein